MDQANELRNLILKTQNNLIKQEKLNAKVITITSGKGGVGKSNISLNLALYLKSMNKRVLIIDADFGLSNIEVLFGVRPKYSFYDIIKGERHISEVITETNFGIKLISGGSGLKELSNLKESQINNFIKQFEYIDDMFDIIIIDTGAGISTNVTNFVKASDIVLLIVTPEPTSFTDAYSVIKVISMENDLLPQIKLIVNKVEHLIEANIVFEKLSNVSEKFLNIDIYNLGYINLDFNLIKAVKKQIPAIIFFPQTSFSQDIRKIGDKLFKEIFRQNDTVKQQDGAKGFIKKLMKILKR